ncbi:hypothetical protein D7B24_006657 [Verticillium nonalfalfae]|uniref:Uncharacterized protein n=1 Tax=Verticillium nonalfalfae TaxID=1051616 RepID=A0A3M9Y9V6_9PEZI|nr:uncharacterized protein D7B24_006657 [Verticillium nonalfalfae]RNJ56905.1 hypothetical protein D7B24_006657 [Verticillium nonalfalfae]
MLSSKAVAKTLEQVGKVSLQHVLTANPATGPEWLRALDTAKKTVQADHPDVTSYEIAGAKAHQSHNVEAHSNVLSVKFFAGGQRVVSGHVHLGGNIDYGKRR